MFSVKTTEIPQEATLNLQKTMIQFNPVYYPIYDKVMVLLEALKWELNIIQLLVLVIKQFMQYIFNPRAFKFHFCIWCIALQMSLSEKPRLASTKANVPNNRFMGFLSRLCQSDAPHSLSFFPPLDLIQEIMQKK